jgi:hypothetical protein
LCEAWRRKAIKKVSAVFYRAEAIVWCEASQGFNQHTPRIEFLPFRIRSLQTGLERRKNDFKALKQARRYRFDLRLKVAK